MQYEKPETVRRADSVIVGQGSNLIDDPDLKPKPEPVKPEPKKVKQEAAVPAVKEETKSKKKRKGGRKYDHANKT